MTVAISGKVSLAGNARVNDSTHTGASQILVATYNGGVGPWSAYWLVVKKVWIPADVTSVQVHIANRDDPTDTPFDNMTTDIAIGTGTLSNPPAWASAPTIYSGVAVNGSLGYVTPSTPVTRDANGYIMIAYYLPPGVSHGLESQCPYGWEQPNALSSVNLVSTLNGGSINATSSGAPLHCGLIFASTSTNRLTIVGDSITRGLAAAGNAAGLPNTIAQIAGTYGVQCCNAGMGGQTFSAVVDNVTPSFFDDVNISSSTVLMIALGSNDLATASLANLQSWLQTLRARYAGMGVKKFWGWTITPKTGVYQNRIDYNAWLLANYVSLGFEYVLDASGLLADPGNTNNLNPLYDSGDHLHPNAAGYTVLVNQLVADGRVGPGGILV